MRIPELAGNENFFTRHPTVFDTLPNFVFVAINQSSINVSVAILQGEGYS